MWNRLGSAEHLPLDDTFADLVLAFYSIDHWRDRSAGLVEVRRVLRPSGRLVVVKDGGLPAGAEAKRAFLFALKKCGFEAGCEDILADGDMSCTIWICGVSAQTP